MEKQSSQYLPITCKTALHAVNGRFPYKQDLNIYRGCENGCKYCFALYSHRYLKTEESLSDQKDSSMHYYDRIYVKENIVKQLEKELSRPNRPKEVINIGGVCDSYQAAENQFELMPDILKLMFKHKNPIIISTKSDLILRDFDLIDELSKVAFVNIAATVTTVDEKLRQKTEPGAVSSERRFQMLEKMKKTDAVIGVHSMPVLPLLTDSIENLDPLFSKTKKVGADYILVGTLYLRSQTRKFYFEFIRSEFPELYDELRFLYRNGGLDKEYKTRLYGEVVNPLLKKYNLSTNYEKSLQKKFKDEKETKQMTLFQF